MTRNKSKKCIGICKVGEKGQIVIPKDARNLFDIKTGDSLIVLADKAKGIALIKAEVFDAINLPVLEEDKDEN